MTHASIRNALLALLFVAWVGESLAETTFVRRAKRASDIARPPRVLYLGDSMSMGEFGKTFDSQLRAAGFEVYTYVAGGATPYYWLSRFQSIASDIGYWVRTPSYDSRKRYVRAVPKVEGLIQTHKPDYVVVQTGTNLYAQLRSKRRTSADNVREVEGLCHDMAATVAREGRRLFWVTPPKAHADRYPTSLQGEMAAIMKRAVRPYGRVFDSRTVTKFVDPYPGTDGIHYGATEARAWAGHVSKEFIRYAGGRSAPKAEPKRVPVVKKAIPINPGETVWGEIDVTLRLKAKTELPHPSKITYQSGCVLYEYEVLRVASGYYPYDTLRVAHLGIFRRQPTDKSRYPLGTVRSWKMMPIETYGYFQRLQLVDDLETDLDKPVYVIKQD